MEKIIIIIKGKNDWRISKENKDFAQERKIHIVEEFIKQSIAKGENNIRTSTNTYLKEYVKSKFTKPILIKLFNIPSKEKTSNDGLSPIDIVVFNFETNSEKEISEPTIFFPIS